MAMYITTFIGGIGYIATQKIANSVFGFWDFLIANSGFLHQICNPGKLNG